MDIKIRRRNSETLDIELFTGFCDGDGNEFWEYDTVMWNGEPYSIVWDDEKGCWSLENDITCTPMAPLVMELERGNE